MNKLLFILLILFFNYSFCFAQVVEDEVAKNLSINSMPRLSSDYNFESTEKIPVKIKILEPIKSECDVFEGQQIKFKVFQDVVYKDKIVIKRGTEVLSTISVIVTPGMNGIPASIIFRDFNIAGIPAEKLTNSYEVFGKDRSLLVFPLKWLLTPLPPTGSLTNFIKGGHAKLKLKKVITIYYYPEWK